MKCVIVILTFVLLIGATSRLAQSAGPDWKAVEQALGNSGQLQPGDVFRIGMRRTDLAVTVRATSSFWTRKCPA